MSGSVQQLLFTRSSATQSDLQQIRLFEELAREGRFIGDTLVEHRSDGVVYGNIVGSLHTQWGTLRLHWMDPSEKENGHDRTCDFSHKSWRATQVLGVIFLERIWSDAEDKHRPLPEVSLYTIIPH